MEKENLVQAAKLLKASAHFVNHSELAPLLEKQSILLALAGKKPVSQVASSKWVKTDQGAHAEPDNIHELEEFLDSLGLAYRIRADEYATNVLVSFDGEKLDAYLAADDANDVIAAGQLFGYPQTAIDAFVRDASMDSDKQDNLMEASGISSWMPSFRFSVAHAEAELAVLKDWYQTLKEYDLV